MEITPELVNGSFIGFLVTYAILFAFNIYVLYLNWKQSKVTDQMEELISEVRGIRKELNKKSSSKKK